MVWRFPLTVYMQHIVSRGESREAEDMVIGNTKNVWCRGRTHGELTANLPNYSRLSQKKHPRTSKASFLLNRTFMKLSAVTTYIEEPRQSFELHDEVNKMIVHGQHIHGAVHGTHPLRSDDDQWCPLWHFFPQTDAPSNRRHLQLLTISMCFAMSSYIITMMFESRAPFLYRIWSMRSATLVGRPSGIE